ncbi:MAG: Crp/Fnr family transcriptional regulator [Chromatiaceae bacterium]|mgnify:CR=1 FL=1|nr:Crp/Fnr family transcriptional regulator [Gammaproteobacteria bacterium]MCP5313976.1 Crp/Fnr family transcriptional regulator [Chromatiaceae bacterium]
MERKDNPATWAVTPKNFLQSLEPATLDRLREMSCHRILQKGETIFSRGSLGENVYVLTEGRAKIYEMSPLGREVILWFCLPGEIFGLAELPSGGRRPVSANACTQVRLLVVSRKRFLAFLESHPKVASLIIELLSCRMRMLGDWMLNMATDDVSARLAKLLLRLRAQYGVPCSIRCGCASQIDFELTHQEIADMIGTSRQTVSTLLNRLKRDGIIQLNRKIMHLIDIPSLDAVAAGIGQDALG